MDIFPYTHLTSLKDSSIWVNLSYTRVACSPKDGFSGFLFYFVFLITHCWEKKKITRKHKQDARMMPMNLG